MSNGLPLLISVPHGGHEIPEELNRSTLLTKNDIFWDGDPYTRHIFSLVKEVLYYHDTGIARAFVDLNRQENDLPPANPDGVLKSQTVMGKSVYTSFPEDEMYHTLLDRYYHPYHAQISADMADSDLLCCFDCHSMLRFPPGTSPSVHNERPFICLSNNGDEHGEGIDQEPTCPAEMINLLADCLAEVFCDEKKNILLNTPFKGGHITRFHGRAMPWIQIEINRRAYLEPQWFNSNTLQVRSDRLETLRQKFLRSFKMFCQKA